MNRNKLHLNLHISSNNTSQSLDNGWCEKSKSDPNGNQMWMLDLGKSRWCHPNKLLSIPTLQIKMKSPIIKLNHNVCCRNISKQKVCVILIPSTINYHNTWFDQLEKMKSIRVDGASNPAVWYDCLHHLQKPQIHQKFKIPSIKSITLQLQFHMNNAEWRGVKHQTLL